MLHERAFELGLHHHPRLAGRVDREKLGPVLLALTQAAKLECRSPPDFQNLLRLILEPIIRQIEIAAKKQGEGLDDGKCSVANLRRHKKPATDSINICRQVDIRLGRVSAVYA